MDLDGYDWSTYLKLKEDKILGSKTNQDWSEGNFALVRYTQCLCTDVDLGNSSQGDLIYGNHTKECQRRTAYGAIVWLYHQ
jgi:hypothetical protein